MHPAERVDADRVQIGDGVGLSSTDAQAQTCAEALEGRQRLCEGFVHGVAYGQHFCHLHGVTAFRGIGRLQPPVNHGVGQPAPGPGLQAHHFSPHGKL